MSGAVVLICDEARTRSALVEGAHSLPDEPALYAGLASLVLERSRMDVLIHLRRPLSQAAPILQAIERIRHGSPDHSARLRVIADRPLEAVLAAADLLVSFASPALITGCRSGLKPVQVGQAVSGSGSFSHVVPGLDAFGGALAQGRLVGSLSLSEFDAFEAFCKTVSAHARTWRDPIVRACRQSRPPVRIGAFTSAVANPLAAWRLVRGGLKRPSRKGARSDFRCE